MRLVKRAVVPPGVVVAAVVVVVVSVITRPRSLDGALDDAFLAGGSAEGARETLRLRVLASGEAKAAFCERVAGIVVVLVGASCVWWRWCGYRSMVSWMMARRKL